MLTEGDRKAYYESSEWTMKQNREKILNLRKENKELRKVMADKLSVSASEYNMYHDSTIITYSRN